MELRQEAFHLLRQLFNSILPNGSKHYRSSLSHSMR